MNVFVQCILEVRTRARSSAEMATLVNLLTKIDVYVHMCGRKEARFMQI